MKVNRRTPLIVGIVGAVVVLGMVVGLILPKASEVRTRQQALTTAKTDEETLTMNLDQLKGAKKEAPANRRRLSKLGKELPETAKLSSIIRLLNTAASDAAVDFISVAPSQPAVATSGSVSTISTQIQVNGSYFSVDDFLFRLESMLRVAKVTTISMTPQGSDTTDLQVNLTAEFYTTDLDAGPGSEPGHSTNAGGGTAETVVSPTPTPSPTQGG